jgi:small subunit ribosomal protein S2
MLYSLAQGGRGLIETTPIKDLLEAGAHFGHPTSQWHPRMKRYIYTKRNGIHIIDLEKTAELMEKASKFINDVVASGGKILFVGTKKQAQDIIAEEANHCGMYYINQRWIGGTLTNFATIQSRVDYLVKLEDQKAKGEFNRLPHKEARKLEKEIEKLNKVFGGIKEMTELPDTLFIVDIIEEKNAVSEAHHMGIPVVATVDTNCDPDLVDYPIPINDDAVKAIKLVTSKIADTIIAAKSQGELAILADEKASGTSGSSGT